MGALWGAMEGIGFEGLVWGSRCSFSLSGAAGSQHQKQQWQEQEPLVRVLAAALTVIWRRWLIWHRQLPKRRLILRRDLGPVQAWSVALQ